MLALRQMVAYADTVVQFLENSPRWEAKNEYSLYKAFLLDIISWGLKKYRTSKQFLWQMCFYLNPEYTYSYMYGREITGDNAVEWKETLFQEAAALYPDSLLFECIEPIECMDHQVLTTLRKRRKSRFARNFQNGICKRMAQIMKLCGFLTITCSMRGFSGKHKLGLIGLLANSWKPSFSISHYKRKARSGRVVWYPAAVSSCTYAIEPPCTGR